MTPCVDVHLTPEAIREGLRADVVTGLLSSPKRLPPKWFYDDVGSKLFDEITRLPEYYPTRRERWILENHAPEAVEMSGADTLVELGSGTSEKTWLLVGAAMAGRGLRRFVPFDVSEATLREASDAFAREHPGLEVHGVVGDFDHHLGAIPRGGRRLFAFLGGTIGNLDPRQRAGFLADLTSEMEPGDSLLLGTDLLKDTARLVAAYDDSAGVTAAFNRNVLAVINRELGADFVAERFEHVARFDADHERVEMWLRALAAHSVKVSDLGLIVEFGHGEEMRTEISTKFRREGVDSELSAAGLDMAQWWTDPEGDFGLSLSFRR